MTNTSKWDEGLGRPSTPGSSILTNWRAEREAARSIDNAADPQPVTYSQSVMDAFGVAPAAASGVAVNATSAMRVSTVAACVSKIAGAIMSMPLNIFELADGEVPAQLPRDELWYLLNERPSPLHTAASHWEGVSIKQLLRGDGHTLILRGIMGNVRELLPIPWGSISPMRVPGGVRYYVNLPSHGISTWFDPEDILHFPGMGFDSETMRSMSAIQWGARNGIGNALAMDEYSGKFFSNGAHPSMILEATKKMNDDQVMLLQNAFARRHSGLDNAHKVPLVLTDGMVAKEFSLSATDSQLLEGRKFQVLDIARAFGVPGYMINESTGSTSWGSGIETLGRAFVQYTLQPWLLKIEQELNGKLYPTNSGRFIEFHRDALYEGDSKAQGDYFRTALGGPGAGPGFMSQDEVRRRKRLAPIPGGSVVYSPPEKSAPPQQEKPEL